MALNADNEIPITSGHRRVRGGLSEIAMGYGTDKGPLENGYTLVYDMLLAPLRTQDVGLMEIGLARGGPEVGGLADRLVADVPSVRMWRDFLPKAHIYGVDISDFSDFQRDWFSFFRADCGNIDELQDIAKRVRDLDVIVDDGSHASFHQKTTFVQLFPSLKPGGLYIIEDLNWQPREYEASLPATPKMARTLFDLSRTGASDQIPEAITREIGAVMLFDEDQLVHLRQGYNAARGLAPKWGHYADDTVQGLAMARRRARRIVEGVTDVANTLVGRRSLPYRTKLGVIQKAM